MKGFLLRRRKELKFTAEEMARKLNSSVSRIHHYEKERRYPSAVDIWSIKEIYQMTTDELLDWLEYINKNNER